MGNLTNNLRRRALEEPGKFTVVFAYFSGHGAMNTTSNIVLNEKLEEKHYFPLESKLRDLSTIENVFVIGLFDCCRRAIKTKSAQSDEIGRAHV